MDDAEKKQQLEIKKGFNAGYLLEKMNPKLSQKLQQGMVDKENPFFIGLAKGAEQYKQEGFFDSPPPNVPDSVEELGMDDREVDLGKEVDGDISL